MHFELRVNAGNDFMMHLREVTYMAASSTDSRLCPCATGSGSDLLLNYVPLLIYYILHNMNH